MAKDLQHTEKRSGKVLTGKVVSVKMKDTVVVAVERFVKHPKYAKYIQITKRYKAHDAGNSKQLRDKVEIIECRPMSKDKHFAVIQGAKRL